MTDAQRAMPQDDDKLKGWKEIAAFLHTSVRTVQRWERGRQLPVRRIETATVSIIYASRHELEEWLLSSAGRSAVSERERGGADESPVAEHSAMPPVVRHPRRGGWVAAGISLSLAGAGVAGWLYLTRDRTPATPVVALASAPQQIPAGANPRTLFLKITSEGKRPSVVGLTPGSLGLAGVPGRKPVGLRPAVVGGRLELRVFRVDGTAPNRQPTMTDVSQHWLEADVPLQIDLPDGRATFEWVSSFSAQPSNLQRGR